MVKGGFLDLKDLYPQGSADTDVPMTVTALRWVIPSTNLKW
jgi:hypothetical protein